MTEGDGAALAALDAQALRAAQAWGRPTRAPRLVQRRENAVFDVTLDDGRRIALRLHRAGYHGGTGVTSELRWMESLADAGFACPWPQRTASGALTDEAAGVTASALQWLTAAPVGAGDALPDPRLGPPTEVLHAIGALLADLHLTSDAVAPQDLARPDWRAPAFCCPNAPIWGRFWDNPALSPADAALLCAARDVARDRLAAIPAAQTGLIHADVLQENVLAGDGVFYLIDFDDGGTGYRVYDLATALIQHADAPALTDLRAALTEGYAAAGGPLPRAAFDDLPMFMALRALASAGWVLGRLPPGDPRVARYADRAVRLARAWLG
ncbi:homoserine kinase [Meridianimarinicoccus roseus]|uniref:Homoserine kinase n=1 Tax=Meridianimarinicoccus roseus TaxID=2072018 RepID=A0A2V2LI68_9RHOB|nr:phosphotransferase [Meridianimarinicoccus roseus]PWR02827.1 homoserine kinase [Meridianimarinicoccus roseus]